MFRLNDVHQQMSLFTSASDVQPSLFVGYTTHRHLFSMNIMNMSDEPRKGIPNSSAISGDIRSSHDPHRTHRRKNANGFYADYE